MEYHGRRWTLKLWDNLFERWILWWNIMVCSWILMEYNEWHGMAWLFFTEIRTGWWCFFYEKCHPEPYYLGWVRCWCRHVVVAFLTLKSPKFLCSLDSELFDEQKSTAFFGGCENITRDLPPKFPGADDIKQVSLTYPLVISHWLSWRTAHWVPLIFSSEKKGWCSLAMWNYQTVYIYIL